MITDIMTDSRLSQLIGLLTTKVEQGNDGSYSIHEVHGTVTVLRDRIVNVFTMAPIISEVQLVKATFENAHKLRKLVEDGFIIDFAHLGDLYMLMWNKEPIYPVWNVDDKWVNHDYSVTAPTAVEALMAIDEQCYDSKYLHLITRLPEFNEWFVKNRKHLEKDGHNRND